MSIHIPTQINDLPGLSWKVKTFADKQLKKNFRSFFDSASHATTKIEIARNNMPLELPGKGLANLSVHYHITKLKKAIISSDFMYW